MWECDYERTGFEWMDCGDSDASVLSFVRRDKRGNMLLCVANFTPVPRQSYRIGVPRGGEWKEALNSDSERYGGGNWGNMGGRTAEEFRCHGRDWSLDLTLPALSFVIFENNIDG